MFPHDLLEPKDWLLAGGGGFEDWLLAGGGGFEDGEDGLRAVSVTGIDLIGFLKAYKEYIIEEYAQEMRDQAFERDLADI